MSSAGPVRDFLDLRRRPIYLSRKFFAEIVVLSMNQTTWRGGVRRGGGRKGVLGGTCVRGDGPLLLSLVLLRARTGDDAMQAHVLTPHSGCATVDSDQPPKQPEEPPCAWIRRRCRRGHGSRLRARCCRNHLAIVSAFRSGSRSSNLCFSTCRGSCHKDGLPPRQLSIPSTRGACTISTAAS